MNVADVVVAALAIFAAFRGFRLGLVRQIFELGGGFIGLIGGLALGPQAADAFTEEPGLKAVLISMITLFVCMSLGQTIGYVIGHRFRSLADRVHLGKVDKGAGIAFGLAVTLLSYWLVGSMLVQGPSRPVARALRQSQILKALNELGSPPDVFAQLRHYLDTSGFPQVFAGLPRPVSPPVDLPSQKETRAAAEAAIDSTVRLTVQACGAISLGSGWIVGENYVVTNAHVVAGGTSVSVHDQAGEHQGTVTLFDPRTDIAVVRVEGLVGPPLVLTTEPQERETRGATLGYPGSRDGELVIRRAAVQARFTATGRDIYGREQAEREVYELRSGIRQGDSGGPFVLASGEVAGVVFAASTTDRDTGYALTGAEVQEEIDRGTARSSATSTGNCPR